LTCLNNATGKINFKIIPVLLHFQNLSTNSELAPQLCRIQISRALNMGTNYSQTGSHLQSVAHLNTTKLGANLNLSHWLPYSDLNNLPQNSLAKTTWKLHGGKLLPLCSSKLTL
jgi:hypothetical protein